MCQIICDLEREIGHIGRTLVMGEWGTSLYVKLVQEVRTMVGIELRPVQL